VVAASSRDHSDPVADQLGAEAVKSGHRAAVLQTDGGPTDESQARARAAGVKTITMPPNGAATAAALAELARQNGDESTSDLFVLVSAPSPETRPTALLLGRSVKRAVLVATTGVTRFSDARRTAELLRQSGVDVVAGLLVPRESHSSK
jgi:hypothetical protein